MLRSSEILATVAQYAQRGPGKKFKIALLHPLTKTYDQIHTTFNRKTVGYDADLALHNTDSAWASHHDTKISYHWAQIPTKMQHFCLDLTLSPSLASHTPI